MNTTTPINKLVKNLSLLKSQSPNKQPVVLVNTGSMNPIHNQHVNMFEMAKKEIEAQDPNKKVVAGYISLLPDSKYMKDKLRDELINSKTRTEMVKLALEDSDWLDIDLWQIEYKRAFPNATLGPPDFLGNLSNYLSLRYKPQTKKVREYFPDGVEVMFICGSDNVEKFAKNRYVGKGGMINRGYKTVVVGREKDKEWKNRFKNILDNEIGINKWDGFFAFADGGDDLETSSTKIRNIIKGREEGDLSKLLHPKVLEYIKKNKILTEGEEP